MQLHHDKPLIWAHRGGRSLAAENTLLAVRKAHQQGADGWETDVVLTRDGIPILLHDLNLLRTTNAVCHHHITDNPPALPWRYTLEEIKKLNAGTFPQRQCGNGVLEQMIKLGPAGPASPDMAVPTLREALTLSAQLGLYVNIEIKDVARVMPKALAKTIVEKVHEIVAEEQMTDRVIISSFNHDYLLESKRFNSSIPTGALTPHDFPGDPLAMLKKFKAEAWHPGHRKLTQDIITAVRTAGFAINPYTVNEPEQMKRLLQWGVSGLVTDYPQLMARL